MKNYFAGFLLICVCLPAFGQASHRPAGKVDLQELFATCGTDWALYSRRLNEMHGKLVTVLNEMSDADYNVAVIDGDPALSLVQVTWPELLQSKDEFAGAFKGCAVRHQQLRSALDTKASAAAKKEAFANFRACVAVDFVSNLKVEPFRSLLACYEKQVGKTAR